MTEEEEREMLKSFQKTQRQFILCVYYKDKIIASAGIMPWMEKKSFWYRASFGICVEEKHWGNGIEKY